MKIIRLIGFPKLTRLEIGQYCFQENLLFEIDNCNELVEVKIGNLSFTINENISKDHIGFAIRNCSKLQLISLGFQSFCLCNGYCEWESSNHMKNHE